MMQLFFLLTRPVVRMLVPLTEGTGCRASAKACSAGAVEHEQQDGQDKDERYEVRHKGSCEIEYVSGCYASVTPFDKLRANEERVDDWLLSVRVAFYPFVVSLSNHSDHFFNSCRTLPMPISRQ
jgi:hypothetical protein